MYMNDYQSAARKTAMGNSLDHFVHGLTEEAGEVAGVMKRFHRGDEKYRNPHNRGRLSDFAQAKLLDEIERLKAEVARKDAALTLAVASDGGIAYSSEDDAVGYRVCCGGSSFNPHDDDCWVTVSRAALTPSQEPRT